MAEAGDWGRGDRSRPRAFWCRDLWGKKELMGTWVRPECPVACLVPQSYNSARLIACGANVEDPIGPSSSIEHVEQACEKD